MGCGDTDSSLSRQIIGCIFKVHNSLGPGFVEKIYQRALYLELINLGLPVEMEHEIDIYYQGTLIGKHYLDLVVGESVIVELKNVENFSKAHYAQVRSYLRASRLKTAVLVNFAGDQADIRRINGFRKSISPIPPIPNIPLPDSTTAETAGETSATRINTGQ